MKFDSNIFFIRYTKIKANQIKISIFYVDTLHFIFLINHLAKIFNRWRKNVFDLQKAQNR